MHPLRVHLSVQILDETRFVLNPQRSTSRTMEKMIMELGLGWKAILMLGVAVSLLVYFFNLIITPTSITYVTIL